MAGLNSLKAQLEVLKKKVPAPEPSFILVRSIVSPNPEPGGPPVREGIVERTTTQIPGPGFPPISEIWEPLATDEPSPLTKADAARFFELIGQARLKRPADAATSAVRDLVLWRNAPGGPAVARHTREGLEVVQPLWQNYQTESQQLAALPSPLSPAAEQS